jgi:hypothetical protein
MNDNKKEAKMRTIVFDTGPIISLTMNNLLWILKPLQEKFGGSFYITGSVYRELIEQPLGTKKYKFEALQILPYISDGTIKVADNQEIEKLADGLLEFANHSFSAEHSWIKIVHQADMEVLAAALLLNADAVVFDERTTRLLVEGPALLKDHLERKLHTNIYVDHNALDRASRELQSLKVIRSFELVSVAYELGLLENFIAKGEEHVVRNLRKTLLEGALWAVKLSGCSVSTEEIDETMAVVKSPQTT